ncbi:MAG: hypothetical protein R2845_00265 [Thermomicrobiales bacterium]
MGLEGFAALNLGADYPDWIDEEMFVAVQIESKEAIENAEAILATPGRRILDGTSRSPAFVRSSPLFPGGLEVLAKAKEIALKAARDTGTAPRLRRKLAVASKRTCG